jgi:hypothetical protein
MEALAPVAALKKKTQTWRQQQHRYCNTHNLKTAAAAV